MTHHWYALPLRECRLEIWVLQGLGPVSLTRCSLDLEHFEDLVDFRVTDKERSSLGHFRKNASNGPDVDRCRIFLRTEQNLGCSIPESHNLMRIGLNR